MHTQYRKAISIIVALALVQVGALPLLAQGPISLKTVESETAGINQFTDSFAKFQSEYSRLMATKLTKLQIQTFQSMGTALKNSVPTYRSNLSAYVAKLKSGGLWTTNLDSQCEMNLAKLGYSPTIAAAIKKSGGYRAVAELILNASANVPALIDEQLKQVSLRGGLAFFNFNLIREAYAVTLTENQKKALKCGLSILAIAACAAMGNGGCAAGAGLIAIDTCPDVELRSLL